jgi:mRNA interferase MazF
MEPSQGDIYWVEIPQQQTSGSEQFGRRPFVVLSRNAVNKALKTVVVAPMSSSIKGQPAFRILIPLTEIAKEISCKTSLVPSVVKTDQVRVIDKSRLGEKIGRLSQTATLSVLLGLAYVFDIR